VKVPAVGSGTTRGEDPEATGDLFTRRSRVQTLPNFRKGESQDLIWTVDHLERITMVDHD
jgi:hypothetical protein